MRLVVVLEVLCRDRKWPILGKEMGVGKLKQLRGEQGTVLRSQEKALKSTKEEK